MKKKLLFFLFITTAVSAQNGYQEHIVIDKSFGSQNPQAVATADINGDGFLDIVTVAGDEIVWYKNLNGSGDFSKPITISDASGGRIDVFDVNKDGFLDVVFTGKWSAKGDGVYW
ncbi:MAG: VCBS repeat-containing protein, partial [Flavobacterium piscis]|nr:VCBS repeat-containing protein [Flavobacterium piscis]